MGGALMIWAPFVSETMLLLSTIDIQLGGHH